MRKRTNRVSADEREDLLCSPAADEFAKALDYCGWMIVLKPQYVGDRWRLNRPSADCPAWAERCAPKPITPDSPRNDMEISSDMTLDKIQQKAMLKWTGEVLQKNRNMWHQNPDGTWELRSLPRWSRPALQVIDGDKKDDEG
jgi:hypothetical protein